MKSRKIEDHATEEDERKREVGVGGGEDLKLKLLMATCPSRGGDNLQIGPNFNTGKTRPPHLLHAPDNIILNTVDILNNDTAMPARRLSSFAQLGLAR